MVIGGFEELVLMAVMHIGQDAYGVPIRERLEEVLQKEVSVGALYTTLDRLEAKGYVTSWMGGATAERGGRAKRYFRIEGAGEYALDEARRAREGVERGPAPAGGWAPGLSAASGTM